MQFSYPDPHLVLSFGRTLCITNLGFSPGTRHTIDNRSVKLPSPLSSFRFHPALGPGPGGLRSNPCPIQRGITRCQTAAGERTKKQH